MIITGPRLLEEKKRENDKGFVANRCVGTQEKWVVGKGEDRYCRLLYMNFFILFSRFYLVTCRFLLKKKF
jgi:hypothetical protein